jgi:hypothetical protein
MDLSLSIYARMVHTHVPTIYFCSIFISTQMLWKYISHLSYQLAIPLAKFLHDIESPTHPWPLPHPRPWRSWVCLQQNTLQTWTCFNDKSAIGSNCPLRHRTSLLPSPFKISTSKARYSPPPHTAIHTFGIHALPSLTSTRKTTNLYNYWGSTLEKRLHTLNTRWIESPAIPCPVSGEIFGHTQLRSECFQDQLFTCGHLSVIPLLDWGIFSSLLYVDR